MIAIYLRAITGGTVLSNVIHASMCNLSWLGSNWQCLSLVIRSRECNHSLQVATWMGATASVMNTLLFLMRARAVFLQSSKWSLFFGALWLTTLSIYTIPFSFLQDTNNPLGYCILEKVERLGTAGPIAIAVFDTVVYISISSKIYKLNDVDEVFAADDRPTSIRGRVSRVLLSTSQMYYL